MGTNGDLTGAPTPLQIPPTRAPRRKRRRWSRTQRTTAVVGALGLVGVSTLAFVNRAVNEQLATVPLVTTTTPQSTTTTVVSRPATPRSKKAPRPVVAATPAETTTSSTIAYVKGEVAESGYDIIKKLDALPVREERSFGYARYRFGFWRDDDGDGCTARDDVIIKQAVKPVSKTSTCDINSGTWKSLYDGVTVTDPNQITVDHVVGLYEAWKSGAWDWTDAKRNEYLNDLYNVNAILAVSDASRDEKDGRDPSYWLPPNGSFRCQYLQTWVDMKTVWKLAVDPGERESIAGAALSC